MLKFNNYSGVWIILYPYLPSLPVFPGVSKFFMKYPGLPVRAPNLPGTSYRGSFNISYSLILQEMYCCCSEKSEIQKNGPLIKMAPTLNIFGVVSRFLYSGGWQVCYTGVYFSCLLNLTLQSFYRRPLFKQINLEFTQAFHQTKLIELTKRGNLHLIAIYKYSH